MKICIRTTMATAIVVTELPMNAKMYPTRENDLHMNNL